MNLKDILAAAPSDVPIASVEINGEDVDIHRVELADIFFIMAKAPGLAAAYADEEAPDRVERLIAEAGKAGSAVVSRLLCAGLRVDREVLAEAELGIDQAIILLCAIVEHSIPRDLLGKLLGVLGSATRGAEPAE